jgi:hypothetical protein
MVSSADSTLDEGPEALDRVRVGIALDVDLGGMVNPLALVASLGHALPVDGGPVGVDHGFGNDPGLEAWHKDRCLGVRDHMGSNPTVALNHLKDRGPVLVRP